MKAYWIAIALVSTLMTGSSAKGEVIVGSFRGTIVDGDDVLGTLGFGTEDGVLDGLPITGTLRYDLRLAPSDLEPIPTLGIYETIGLGPNWLSIENIVIGGIPIPPFAPLPLPVSQDPYQLGVVDLEPVSGGLTLGELFFLDEDIEFGAGELNYAYRELFLSFANPELFPSDALPRSINNSDFVSGDGVVFFLSEDASGNPTQIILAVFDIDEINAQVVPEPSPIWMWSFLGVAVCAVFYTDLLRARASDRRHLKTAE